MFRLSFRLAKSGAAILLDPLALRRLAVSTGSLGQQMGQHAPQIPADPSGTQSAENRLKPSPT
jgi:hypothetical protein